MSELHPETEKSLAKAVEDLDAGKSTPAKRRTRKEPAPAPEPVILHGSGLVRENEAARNSQSVRTVQEALVERGHWEVAADPSGYWGKHTQAAAEKETGEEDPVKAAEALGFAVLPVPPAV
jgi:hypothetical protein